jgi:predicted nucleotidyltransferase
MKLDEGLKNQLKERLKQLDPEKVILFGSYAYGQPHLDSDIDLIVVLKDISMPTNFKENIQIYLKVSSVIRDLKRRFPIDIIVYTKPMYEKFSKLDSNFSKEIFSKGIDLL